MLEQKIVPLSLSFLNYELTKYTNEGWRAISISADPHSANVFVLLEREHK